jgi:hypothetical protein
MASRCAGLLWACGLLAVRRVNRRDGGLSGDRLPLARAGGWREALASSLPPWLLILFSSGAVALLLAVAVGVITVLLLRVHGVVAVLTPTVVALGAALWSRNALKRRRSR